MNISEYSQKAKRTIPDELPVIADQRLLLLNMACTGLFGEGGELTDHVKKHIYHGHPLDKEYIEKELGDALWYLNAGCEAIGTTLDAVAQRNIAKLDKRYPDGFSSEASINRTE